MKARTELSGQAGTLFACIPTVPKPATAEELYCDLLKRTLTRAVISKSMERQTLRARMPIKRHLISMLQHALGMINMELVRTIECQADDYLESGDSATNRMEDAETMVGIRQLDAMQACISDVLQADVPGDLLEAGVWRGGMAIFMRGVLKSKGETKRRVWVADSFQGLPQVNRSQDRSAWWWRAGDMSVSEEAVRANFARFGLLEEQVQFLKGFFADSLPTTPIDCLAILRIDADLYQSTREVLENLYPKLSRNGYCIVDDYQNLPDCRRAVDQYRQINGILDPIVPIDKRAVFWKRT